MWQLLFWGSVALIIYTYVGYPACLYLLGLVRRKRALPAGDQWPSVCLIISAFNEQEVIRAKIENSLELDYPRDKLTILVASDGCDDDTVDIAREYVECGVKIYHHARRRGKSAVLNDVVADLKQDVMVFTDANALLASGAIQHLGRRFAEERVGCVVGRLRYTDRDETSTGRGEGTYWAYEGLLSRLESRLGSVLVANGAIFAVRRGLFRRLHPDVANDFQIPADVAAQGWRVVYEPRALASERVTVHWREEFDRKARIILRGLTGYSLLKDRIGGMRRWQFVSHKLLRWLVGPLAIVALVGNIALATSSPFFAVVLVLQAAFYLCAALAWLARTSRRPGWVLYIPFYFTMVNAAGVFALARFVGGARQSVWEKAASTRLSPDPPRAAGSGAARPAVGAEKVDLEAKIGKN